MLINTANPETIVPIVRKLRLPNKISHKGENGRLLVIGGSSLFHAASLWAAEIASHFVDIVHYSSTIENNKVFLSLKKKFRNGIVVSQKDIPVYIEEDDAILVGPGMMRGKELDLELSDVSFQDVLKIQNEYEYTRILTGYLLKNFPEKQFILDAGALQMMDREWLMKMKKRIIATPHQAEFLDLFGIDVRKLNSEEKMEVVLQQAKKYRCIILLKAVDDFISDGTASVRIMGGNAGLTKGGTGDILAGLTSALTAKHPSLESAVLASYLLKKTAEELFLDKGYWYNISDIIDRLPSVFYRLVS